MATSIANHDLAFGVRIKSISEVYHGVYLLIEVFQFDTDCSVHNCNCVLVIKLRMGFCEWR